MLPSNPTSIDYVKDVITVGLQLADDRVNIYNEKFDIPPDKYLFVTIAHKLSKPFGSKSETTVDSGVFNEHLGLNMQEHYAIILMSRNHDALKMKERAVMALDSIYARQQGDAHGFRIARIAPIQDLSSLEGAGILYRYEIDIIMFCRYEYIHSVPYYGTFAGQLTVENGEDITSNIQPAST